MSRNAWSRTLITAQIDGTALTNSTVATDLLPAAAIFTLPTNELEYAGIDLDIEAWGRISTLTAAPGTLTLQVRFGASTVVFDGGAMSLNVVAKTNVGWKYKASLTVRGIGAAATVIGQGEFASEAVIGSPLPTAGGSGVLVLPFNTAPVVGSAFDSTAVQPVRLFATWGTASTSNSIQLHKYKLKLEN